ncbi:uncharacterized protein J7T54_006289 [Emericellopsis cladophorae]|uniref:HMG box domain-containing protein n=1 Tax=Emericellopsis cladophorae TaxID=2686198 RepID=A0A9P9Y9P9_9HYPO|nr:uncharacterized protein J7T54_006289 [Emericellopsis cladophorae]KAI6785950.1 hypothetical protein J7T54_006289 [Emericellopsis cladophorae]
MLTSVGRAAARRVVAGNRLALTTNGVAIPRATFVARAIPIRSFSVSQRTRQATATDSPAKPKKATKAKKSTKPKAAKAKTSKAKKPAVKKPKKVPTPEEAEKKKIKELKARALLKEEPRPGPHAGQTEWTIFVGENTPTPLQKPLAEHVRELSARFKDISSSEKQRLASQAEANRQAYQNKRQSWLASLDVADVYSANLARSRLRRALPKKQFSKLEDDRLPKKPVEGMNLYVQERMKGQSGSSVIFSEVVQEWKNMDAAQQRSYKVASEPALVAWRQAVEQLSNAVAEKKRAKKDAAKAEAAAAKAAQIQAREERKAAKAAQKAASA